MMDDLQFRLHLLHRLHHEPGVITVGCLSCHVGLITIPAWPERDNRTPPIDPYDHLNAIQVPCPACGWMLQLVYSMGPEERATHPCPEPL